MPKSLIEKATTIKRKKGKGGGLDGALGDLWPNRRGKRQRKGLDSQLELFKGKRGGWKLDRQAAESLRRRMTRTERMVIQDAIDDELEHDQAVGGHYRDEKVIGNESWLRRLVRLARERLGYRA